MHKKVWSWFRKLNDVWDAIKYVAAAAAGTTMVVGTLAIGITGIVRNLPLSWQIVLFVGLFFLFLVAAKGVSVLLLIVYRRLFPNAEKLSENDRQLLADTLNRAEQAESAVKQLSQPAGWMNTMMRDDRENLSRPRKISVTKYTAHGSHLRDTEPYVTFFLHIFNRTVFRVEIGSPSITSKILWGDSELRNPPKLKDNRPLVLERGENGVLEMQQDVLPDTAQKILGTYDSGKEVEFEFKDVGIPITAYAPDETQVGAGTLNLPFAFVTVARQ